MIHQFLGFLTFFVVEKFMRIIRGEGGHGHSHSHAHHPRPKPTKKATSSDNETDDERSESDAATKQRSRRGSKNQREHKDDEREETQHLLDSTHHELAAKSGVAWILNLVADMMHNFTDGLAIGASFIAGTTVGVGNCEILILLNI